MYGGQRLSPPGVVPGLSKVDNESSLINYIVRRTETVSAIHSVIRLLLSIVYILEYTHYILSLSV